MLVSRETRSEASPSRSSIAVVPLGFVDSANILTRTKLESPPAIWGYAHPPLLPRNRLRRTPPIQIPLENLRTGNSLFCIGWRNGRSWFLTPAQYFSLVENLPSVTAQKKQKSRRLPDELESDKPEYDEFASYLRRNRPDSLADRDWVYGSPKPPDEADQVIVAFMEAHPPQPPPDPFPGAELYSGALHQFGVIPSLKRKTAAKQEKNLARFAAEKRQLCAERKAEFKFWNKKLREALGSHSNSHTGGGYETESCPRCGASFFVNKRRVCFDCGYTLGEIHYRSRTHDLVSFRDASAMPLVQEITKRSNQRRRRCLTPEQFVAGLILRGQLANLTTAASLEKASGTYQILCEGWLPRDVAKLSDDSERAIASRAERLFDSVAEHEAKGEPLPHPNSHEINQLKRHFAYVRNEIPSLRRAQLCIN